MKYCLLLALLLLTTGCVDKSHQMWVENMDNSLLGQKYINNVPKKNADAGKLIRSNYLLEGEGLTHITKDKDGNIVNHLSISEVLPAYSKKNGVGKCLIYLVVDPKTHIILNWGFDEGGNPMSCRIWP